MQQHHESGDVHQGQQEDEGEPEEETLVGKGEARKEKKTTRIDKMEEKDEHSERKRGGGQLDLLCLLFPAFPCSLSIILLLISSLSFTYHRCSWIFASASFFSSSSCSIC